jgi:putative transposase
MSRNFYSEIHLHITWHVKESAPLLTAQVEPVMRHAVRGKCINTPGVFIHEIGGIETHVHVCVSIAPTVHISEFIGQLKGFASHEVNSKLGAKRKLLEWQTGYGVVSFGTKDLDWVKSYVQKQREHHSRGTFQARLERIDPAAEAEQREVP